MKKFRLIYLFTGILISAFFICMFSPNVAASTEFELTKTEIFHDTACSYYKITNTKQEAMQESTLQTLSLADNQILKDKGYVNGIKHVVGVISNGQWEWQVEESHLKISNETPEIMKAKVWRGIGDFIAVEQSNSSVKKVILEFSRIRVPPSKSISVRYCADIKREFTQKGLTVAVDHIPSFDGVDYLDWAWWNSTTFVVQIVGSSSSSLTESKFTINGCGIDDRGDNIWHLYANHSDFEISRALVHKTLFYGTDGTNPAVTNISGLEELQVPNATRDIGKRAHYAYMNGNKGSGDPGFAYYIGTLNDTSNNLDSSVWGYTYISETDYCPPPYRYSQIELPTGLTVQQSLLAGCGTDSDDTTGTDMSVHEASNPASAMLRMFGQDAGGTYNIKAILLASGSMNWSNYGSDFWGNTDFYINHSVPAFTAYNNKPVMSQSIVNSSDGSNRSDKHLQGFCKGTDLDGRDLIYHYKWYRNQVLHSSGQSGNFSAGINHTKDVEVNAANVSNNALVCGEWIFSCVADDNYKNSTGLNSTPLNITCVEDDGRDAIEDGILDAFTTGYTLYTDWLLYVRLVNTSQKQGRFDKLAAYGNQRWAFNYLIDADDHTDVYNIAPVLYVWEEGNLTDTQIASQVSAFITGTRN
ncbi:hypothetical protein ACFL6S_18605 [Candidatus Poribacteria bacterium]